MILNTISSHSLYFLYFGRAFPILSIHRLLHIQVNQKKEQPAALRTDFSPDNNSNNNNNEIIIIIIIVIIVRDMEKNLILIANAVVWQILRPDYMRDFSRFVSLPGLKIQLSFAIRVLWKQSCDNMMKVLARFAGLNLQTALIKQLGFSSSIDFPYNHKSKFSPGWIYQNMGTLGQMRKS